MDRRHNTIDIMLPAEDDNIFFVSSLENELKQYQSQNLTLKQLLNELETDNKLKDKLLDEKSKRIISITVQNLRLKQQIKALKNQLRISNAKRKSVLLKKKRRRKLGKRIKHKNAKLEYKYKIYNKDFGDSIRNMQMQRNGRMKAIDILQMPYLIKSLSKSVSISALSQSPTLSEQACKLSFPMALALPDLNPSPWGNDNDNEPPTDKPFLSPIAESTSKEREERSQRTQNGVGLTISDNNQNIAVDEWDDCMAAISPTPTPTPRGRGGLSALCFVDDYDGSSSVSLDDDNTISYMSDNTVLLMDMNFNKLDKTNYAKLQGYNVSNSHSHSGDELPEKTIRITTMHNETSCDQTSGCDRIIQSPVCNLLKPKNESILHSNSNMLAAVHVDNNQNAYDKYTKEYERVFTFK